MLGSSAPIRDPLAVPNTVEGLLFLNKSDIISQAYAQAVTDDNKERVIWGNATYYPICAHTYGQWQEDAPKNPDALGQDNPKVDYDNVWLDIANDISKGKPEPAPET